MWEWREKNSDQRSVVSGQRADIRGQISEVRRDLKAGVIRMNRMKGVGRQGSFGKKKNGIISRSIS